MSIVPFGIYAPDLPRLSDNIVFQANNVIAFKGGYKPIPSLVERATGIDSRVMGGASFKDSINEINIVVAGSADKLWILNGSTEMVDISSMPYNTPETGMWSFVRFGPLIIATNYADPIQAYELGVSTVFAALGGSSPKARYLATVKAFVVAANVIDSDGAGVQRVRWSGLEDATTWVESATTQSDFQDLVGDGGVITGIVGGEYGIIFQESSIWRMTYVGAPLIFQFDEIEKNRGCNVPGSIANVGKRIFYLSPDGFYMFDGSGSTPIGDNLVDAFFAQNVNVQYLDRITSAIDPLNKCYLLGFVSTDSADGSIDKALIYNYVENKWSTADLAIDILIGGFTSGYTLEELDNFSTNIDTLTPTLDSPFWNGGSPILAAFDSNHSLSYFSGTNMEAIIETNDLYNPSGQRLFLGQIRPITDASNAQVALNYSSLQSTAKTATAYGSTFSRTGIASFRVNCRYSSILVKIPSGATWTYAQGVEVDKQVTGGRS